MKIYALGGLGADKRTFSYINLKKHELVCLDWLDPFPNETLHEYAIRLNGSILDQGQIGLVGVSFGGMIMTEVAKLRNPKHTVLISSVSRSSDLRWAYRMAGTLRLDKFFPYSLTIKSGRLIHYLFGVRLMRDRELLSSIMEDMDPNFIKWAVGVILRWESEDDIEVVRIHGTKDRVLPVEASDIDHPISGAGHFIIVNEAEKISEIIDEL